MQTHDSSLVSKAFGEHADTGLIVAYQSHQDALRFLSSALGQANGIALLQGPSGAGKTTIVKEQLAWSSRDASVAFVEGMHLTPRRLMTDMLSQFGVETDSEDDEKLLHELNNFVTHETRFARPPVLIVDNADHATLSALRLLNWVAALEIRGNYAVRIVLTGKEGLSSLPWRDGMRSLARRVPATYSLNPLSEQETMIYLRTRLMVAGSESSEEMFPLDTCEQLHELSCGWPGALNEHAIEAMESSAELQSAKPIPRIILTHDGEILAEHDLTERQYVIGRSRIADLIIADGYVSKLHALLQIHEKAIILADLNSTNGTTVNSRMVGTTILESDDIIMLGRHRIKIENAPPISAEMEERINAADTMTMRSLDDLRLARAKRTITMLKHQQGRI
jgi:type II secretory pathway predicted ATPase ExeA